MAKIILEDAAVESVSSFIGVDGTNTTLNSGRMLINLKPHSQRSRRDGCHPPVEGALAEHEGMRFIMQPVQDLTIEDRVSRTQYPVHARYCESRRAQPVGAPARRAPWHNCRS